MEIWGKNKLEKNLWLAGGIPSCGEFILWAADLGGSNSVSKLMRNSDIFGSCLRKKDIWAVSVKGSVFHSPRPRKELGTARYWRR